MHPGDTCGKNEEYEAGQLLMSLQERPEKKKRKKQSRLHFFWHESETNSLSLVFAGKITMVNVIFKLIILFNNPYLPLCYAKESLHHNPWIVTIHSKTL